MAYEPTLCSSGDPNQNRLQYCRTYKELAKTNLSLNNQNYQSLMHLDKRKGYYKETSVSPTVAKAVYSSLIQ